MPSNQDVVMREGAKVFVYAHGTEAGRKVLGRGIINEIYTHPRDGAIMAAVRVDGETGRYLRPVAELSLE